MKKIKVCFLAYTDYGNTMTYWSHAINKYSTKYESKIICITPHQFQYEINHDVDLSISNENGALNIDQAKKNEAIEWILQCDQIIFAEEMSLFNNPRRYKSMQVFQQILGFHLLELKMSNPLLKLHIWHCGIDYRLAHKQFDEINEQYFDKILLGGDLYRLSPKTKKYYVPIVSYQTKESNGDIFKLILKKFNDDIIKVFHAPSSHSTKGTETIRKVVQEVFNQLPSYLNDKVVYEEITPPVKNVEIIEMKKKSHIYIDQYHQDIGGYGISSVEALAYGNIVLSSIHCMEPDALELQCQSKEMAKEFPIIDTSLDLEVFKNKLIKLLVTPKIELRDKAIKSFEFYQKLFTFKAISNYFEQIIFNFEE
ncbi:MAG: hypothetical protein COB02_14520 [Candidatus Cloacimonadota bacterium]|nr:MAG: hypothetical protein COB02_14520 [Candidatus Cloacimonadota bacterium]